MTQTVAKTHQFGILGMGARSCSFIKCLNMAGGANIVACADPDAGSREKAMKFVPSGCTVHDDARRILDDDRVEIVYVGTPNFTHVDLVIPALEAGKAVICEKPMATTVEDCDRMIEAIERTGGFFALSMQNRYSFWCSTMTQMLRDGDLGDPRMMWCHEFRRPFSPTKVDQWIFYSEKSGGPYVEKNSHHWDIFNWWAMSPPVRVHAVARNHNVHAPGDIWDCGWATVEYENGVIANLGLSMNSPNGHDLHMGVIGGKGWVESFRTRDGGVVHMHPNDNGEAKTFNANMSPEQAELGHAGAELPMIDHLFECIEQHKTPITNHWWGRESILVGVAAEQSAREGRVVNIADLRRDSRYPDRGPDRI